MNFARVYIAHSDSGHGWLAVPRAELAELGIADRITPYSYQRGETVYLEEDCDLSTYIEARRRAGLGDPVQRLGKWCERSPVRSYSRYSVGGGL
jgi:hypothetical protein